MRRDTLLAVAFLLSAIGELEWAAVFYRSTPADVTHALILFVAGAAVLLVSGGLFFSETRSWTLFTGLLVAALAHAAYLVTTTSFPAIDIVAAALLFAGTAVAAWGTRGERFETTLVRVGLGIACLGPVIWTYGDATQGGSSINFVTGDVFAAVGYAASAIFAGPSDGDPSA
jgi:hypothetical protein